MMQPPSAAAIDLDSAAALRGARAALAACEAMGNRVVVVVAGSDGIVRVQLSSAHVAAVNVAAARRKALTAVLTRAPTLDLARIARAEPGYGDVLRNLDPDMLPVGGGLPVLTGADLTGAIAVAGAPGGEFDDRCARAGLDRMSASGR